MKNTCRSDLLEGGQRLQSSARKAQRFRGSLANLPPLPSALAGACGNGTLSVTSCFCNSRERMLPFRCPELQPPPSPGLRVIHHLAEEIPWAPASLLATVQGASQKLRSCAERALRPAFQGRSWTRSVSSAPPAL